MWCIKWQPIPEDVHSKANGSMHINWNEKERRRKISKRSEGEAKAPTDRDIPYEEGTKVKHCVAFSSLIYMNMIN